MKNILSKQSSRFLTTLDYLFHHQSSTISHLANLSNVSITTVIDDIKKINDFIAPLSIELDGNHHCHLIHHKKLAMDFIYSNILKNSTEFYLLEKVFFERHNRLEDYADSLFISVSTLKRIISKMNKEMKPLGFEITTNPIKIVGDECQIRHIFVNYFSEKYLERPYPLNNVQKKLFEQLVMSYVDLEKRVLNYPDLEKLRLILYVSLIRLQNGHHYTEKQVKKIENRYEFPILTNSIFLQAFKGIFQIELNRTHVIELAYPFLSNHFAFNQEELDVICSESTLHQTDLIEITQLVTDIEVSLEILLSRKKKERLILALMNIRLFTIETSYLIYDKHHYFLTNLARDFPLAYRFLHHHIIEHDYFGSLKEDEYEALIYVLITHWEALLPAIQFSYSEFKVALFMNSDTEHTQFLANILNKKFYSRYTFSPIVFLTNEEAFEQFSQFDLILTNISTTKEFEFPVICIDLYPSKQDIAKLNHMYDELCLGI
ncbi:MAG: helix-turn-helix domain-containing protein [Vagococcus sp.]|uniref:helix-turn-helix domain-containing protein n=1 Tax=Vagococcus sp. TaxID=1933889 RepID=UPI002FC96AFB